MLNKPPTGEYLYRNGKKCYNRCVLGERLYTIEEMAGVHRFDWLFTERFRDKVINEYKDFFSCNEGEEVWWYDDIRFLSGSAGMIKIKGDQIVEMKILIRS